MASDSRKYGGGAWTGEDQGRDKADAFGDVESIYGQVYVMKRIFNVSADCKPDLHYMVDIGERNQP